MRVYKVLEGEHWWNGGPEKDPLPPKRQRVIPGFDDCSDLLGPGVYVLLRDGEVVFVAWAKNALERIADHRKLLASNLPSWFPVKGIVYDRFHFRRCAEDVGDRLVTDLIALHDPIHNRKPPTHAAISSA